MTTRALVTVGIYVVIVVVAFATPLFDDSFSPVLLVAMHLGLGVGVARPWALAVPLVTAVAGLLIAWPDDDGLTSFLVIVATVPAAALTAVGWALGRARPRISVTAGVICGAACALALASAVVGRAQRGPHLPPSVQARLPLKLSLGNLCPGAESSEAVLRDVRARGEVLVAELRARPNHLVKYTYYWAHVGEDIKDITVRKLAEEQLADLESGGFSGSGCAPDLQERLRAEL